MLFVWHQQVFENKEKNSWLYKVERPVAGLLPEPLLDAGAQRLLVVQPVEPLQDAALVGLVLVPARVDLGDQRVEVGVAAQRAPGDQLLPAGWTLLVPGRGGDASLQTVLSVSLEKWIN